MATMACHGTVPAHGNGVAKMDCNGTARVEAPTVPVKQRTSKPSLLSTLLKKGVTIDTSELFSSYRSNSVEPVPYVSADAPVANGHYSTGRGRVAEKKASFENGEVQKENVSSSVCELPTQEARRSPDSGSPYGYNEESGHSCHRAERGSEKEAKASRGR